MHASIEQLLTIRDAKPASTGNDSYQSRAAVRGHLENCDECKLELQRIETLQADLQSLSEVEPVAESVDAAWAAVLARSTRKRPTRKESAGPAQWRPLGWPLGLAASLLIAALIAILMPRQANETPVVAKREGPIATVPETAQLVARSQQLEQMLGSLQYEPRVVNARTAGTIAQLEDQIAWIDYGLGEGSDGQLSESDARALWQQRVELMNSLVHVRYAQAQRVDF